MLDCDIMRKIIICLTGMPGSGKTTVAEMLKSKGFTLVELSGELKRLMEVCGTQVDIHSREKFTVKLKKAFGRDILAKLSAASVARAKGNVVISGVRNTAELAYIRTLNPNVAMIALLVPKDLRYDRIMHRKEGIPTANYREFEWRDKRNVALGMLQVIRSADYTLTNTGTVSHLESDIDAILKKLGGAKRRPAK
jgi:dephospho-CoA kinase